MFYNNVFSAKMLGANTGLSKTAFFYFDIFSEPVLGV